MFKIIKRIAIALVLSSGLVAVPGMATVLSFSPASTTAAVGANVAVEVRVEGLGPAQDLAAFDFKVLFDASKLSFSSYTLGNGLGDLGLFEALDFSAGTVASGVLNLAEVSFLFDLGAQGDSFTLATLNFTSLVDGGSMLSFMNATLSDAFGNALTASTGSAAVTAVPEPGTPYLLMSVLVLMGFVRRARK